MLLEILAWLCRHRPDEAMRPPSDAHVLVSTAVSAEMIQAIAVQQGWRYEVVDARLFKVIKVWIENAILIHCEEG